MKQCNRDYFSHQWVNSMVTKQPRFTRPQCCPIIEWTYRTSTPALGSLFLGLGLRSLETILVAEFQLTALQMWGIVPVRKSALFNRCFLNRSSTQHWKVHHKDKSLSSSVLLTWTISKMTENLLFSTLNQIECASSSQKNPATMNLATLHPLSCGFTRSNCGLNCIS